LTTGAADKKDVEIKGKAHNLPRLVTISASVTTLGCTDRKWKCFILTAGVESGLQQTSSATFLYIEQ